MSLRVRQFTLVILGMYVCLAATIAHRHTAPVAGVDVPWGLLLGLGAAYLVARAVAPWVRLGAAFFALGWAAGLTLPMLTPGDSYLVAQDWLGMSFLLVGLGLLALAVVRATDAD